VGIIGNPKPSKKAQPDPADDARGEQARPQQSLL